MNGHHCSVCGSPAEEDPMSWCGDRECCSPSYLLPCGCSSAFVCDCDEEHAAAQAEPSAK